MNAVEIDSVDGEMNLCDVHITDVAVIPRDHGEYTVYFRLPEKVAASGIYWGDIVSKAITKFSERDCCNGATRAYQFYLKVLAELQTWEPPEGFNPDGY